MAEGPLCGIQMTAAKSKSVMSGSFKMADFIDFSTSLSKRRILSTKTAFLRGLHLSQASRASISDVEIFQWAR